MLAITLFGVSKTFVTLIVSRALSGALNGNVGVMKSMMAEITDETNQAQAFSFMPLVFSGELYVSPLNQFFRCIASENDLHRQLYDCGNDLCHDAMLTIQ